MAIQPPKVEFVASAIRFNDEADGAAVPATNSTIGTIRIHTQMAWGVP
jgi:hypothetical protein